MLLENLMAFLRGLRSFGFVVGSDEEALVLQALAKVGWEQPDLCRYAVKAIVVRHPEQGPVFDALWQQFQIWLAHPTNPLLSTNTLMANIARMRQERLRQPQVIWMGANPSRDHTESPEANARTEMQAAWRAGASRREALQKADFARLTEAEQREISQLAAYLKPLTRLGRRLKPAKHGRILDMSRTLRQGAAYGEVFHFHYQCRKEAQRPLVLILDVSGSMEPYSRMLLRFVHVLLQRRARLEAFVFSTRLTRITYALRHRDANRALAEVAMMTPDFAGGTRLAEALAEFNRTFARRVLQRGAAVLLATDGFDAGEPSTAADASRDPLAFELARLRRRTHRLLWLNPLMVDPAYQPTAQAARILAAHVDDVVPAYNWAALETMWELLRTRADRRPVRSSWSQPPFPLMESR
jgi:uncharacterized protein with von Willebrand factor type A (vWA) domain